MRRSVKYGLYGAVLAGMVGGTVAWASVDKTVTLRVDGLTTTEHTEASDVRGALDDAGYRLSDHDIVAPAPNAKVHDGSQIVLKRGRLLHLVVDGVARNVWVTTPTVAEALAQLGYTSSDFTSVSRDKRLPLTPTDIELRTPKTVTVVADGRTRTVQSTDATVGQLLADLGIKVGAADRLSTAPSSALRDQLDIVLKRVRTATITTSAPVPYPVVRRTDPTLSAGSTTVITPGRAGLARITWAAVYVDGTLVGRTKLSTTIVTPAVPQVVAVGTKAAPPAVPAAPPASPDSAEAIGRELAKERGWGDSEFNCLFQLWGHESGWRVNASNASGAYGIPQALPGSKMGAYGADWATNPATQIKWGLAYIGSRYGTPCGAWSSWQSNGWY